MKFPGSPGRMNGTLVFEISAPVPLEVGMNENGDRDGDR